MGVLVQGEAVPVTEVTRFLCGAAYNLRDFRDTVIKHVVEDRERVLAPSYGVDAVAVTWHCLRARRAQALRELVTLATVVAFALTSLPTTVFALYTVVAMWLPRRWMRHQREMREQGRPQPALARYVLTFALAVNALLAPALYALLTAAVVWTKPVAALLNAHANGSEHTLADHLIVRVSTPTLLALPLVLMLVASVERGWRARLAQRLAGAHVLAPLPDTAVRLFESREQRALRRIRRQQLKTHVVYGADVFIGAGTEYSSWSFATHLRPKPDLGGDAALSKRPAGSGPLLKTTEVIDAVRAGLLRFQAEKGGTVDRLSQIKITDYVFSPPGDETYAQETPALEVVQLADEQVRHFLGIRVGGWDQDLIASTFVRPSTHGDILYLEVVVRILAPLKRPFRDPVLPVPPEVRPKALLGMAGDLRRLLPRDAVRVLLSWRPAIGPDQEEPDGHDYPAFSLRQYVASPNHNVYFQRLDAERYVKTVERRIISSIRDLLEAKDIAADEFASLATQVVNQGVMITGGNNAGNNFSTGDNNTMTAEVKTAPPPVPAPSPAPTATPA